MGLHRYRPLPSGRMGVMWTLSTIRDAALIEFGCMGHMRYGIASLECSGVIDGCKFHSTHIEETDIALGSTDKLNYSIADVARRDHPKVIFLQPSAVPQVIGTDIPALISEIQPQYPDIKLLPFGGGGFDITLHRGVQEALLQLVKSLPVETPKTAEPSFNIIGSCADLFRFRGDTGEILRMMDGAFGMKPICVLSSDTSIDQISKMGGAHINLVIRREGEPAAKQLQKQFGTPYVLGRPYGIEGTLKWLEEISQASGLIPETAFLESERNTARKFTAPVRRGSGRGGKGGGGSGSTHSGPVIALGGHADVVKGILSFACGELNFMQGPCWCDSPDMASAEVPHFTEEQWVQAVEAHEYTYLMAGCEALELAGQSLDFQISNPDTKWQLYPYEPPFVGFRGAMYLAHLWVNGGGRSRRKGRE